MTRTKSRKKTTKAPKRASKPAAKATKPANGTPTAPTLDELQELIDDMNGRLKAAGKPPLVTWMPPQRERDSHRSSDGQLLVDSEAERKILQVEADPPTTDARFQPIGDLVARALGADPAMYEEGYPWHWGTFDGVMLATTETELRALAIALEHRQSDLSPIGSYAVAEFDTDDAIRMLTTLSHRLAAGIELSSRLREARWGDPRFGGFDAEKVKRIIHGQREETETEDAATESEAAS